MDDTSPVEANHSQLDMQGRGQERRHQELLEMHRDQMVGHRDLMAELLGRDKEHAQQVEAQERRHREQMAELLGRD